MSFFPSISGTTNQITVTNAGTSITLATPQSIASTSTPTFAGASLTPITAASGSTTTLTSASNNCVVFAASATANTTIALPALASGYRVRIVFQAVSDGSHTWTVQAPSACVAGQTIGVGAGLAATLITTGSPKTNVIRTATAANTSAGDYIDYECDGTNYWVHAFSFGTATAWSTS